MCDIGSELEVVQAFTDVFRRALFVVKTSWFIGINSLRAGAADPRYDMLQALIGAQNQPFHKRLAFTPKS